MFFFSRKNSVKNIKFKITNLEKNYVKNVSKKILCKNFVCFDNLFGIYFFHLLEDIKINFLELWDDDFPELELEVLLFPSSS